MKKFISITMKCNQEQFDKIKPILEKNELLIYNIADFGTYKYLVNDYMGSSCISNVSRTIGRVSSLCFEEWNQNKFLECCGIEEEEVIWNLSELQYRTEGSNNWSSWSVGIGRTEVRIKPKPDCSAKIEELQRQIDELKKNCL
jgi:hypothetical protein